MSFFSLFKSSAVKNTKSKSRISSKKLRMEPLEERRMLAVISGTFTADDLTALQRSYGGLNFDSHDSYINGPNNVAVYDAADLLGATPSDTTAAIKSALDTAAAAPGNDVFVIKLNGDTTLTLSEELSLANANGSITIVTMGTGTLKFDANNGSRILNLTDTNFQLGGVTLTGGNASTNGGAISFVDNPATSGTNFMNLSGVILSGNKATDFGGGIYQQKGIVNLYNVLMTGNVAGSGGAMAIGDSTSSTASGATTQLVNVTIADNGSGLYTKMLSGSVSVYNSIFSANGGSDVNLNQSGTRTFSHNLFSSANSAKVGTNNIVNADPNNTNKAGDPKLENYHPTMESTDVLNKGNDTHVTGVLATDLAGLKRIFGEHVDLGAYEYPELTAANDSFTYDLNRDFSEAFEDFDVLDNDNYYMDNPTIQLKTNEEGQLVDLEGNVIPLLDSNMIKLGEDGKTVRYNLFISPDGSIPVVTFYYRIADDAGNFSDYASVTITPGYSALNDKGEIVVTDMSDDYNQDFSQNDLTLREAVEIAAMLGTTIPAPRIVFAENLEEDTITLNYIDSDDVAQPITISNNVTIAGAGITIDAAGLSRIFHIEDANVTLVGLTLEGGFSEGDGGAIYASNADLTLTDLIFFDNTAVNGGAVFAASTSDVNVKISGVTFQENRASVSGGALYVAISGTLTIEGSVFDHNTAITGDGGATVITAGEVAISHSLFMQNFAENDGGAIRISADDAVFTNLTVVENDGDGIHNSSDTAVIEINNSIVALNAGNDVTGRVTGKNNLIGNRTGSVGLTHGTDGNLLGVPNAPLDPRLDAEYKPTEFSLAVGNGSDGKDIGWFDTDYTANDIIWVTNLKNTGENSLRWALDQAATADGHDAIMFADGLTGSLTLSSRLLVNSDVSVYGLGNTISGNDRVRIFTVQPEYDFYLSGLNLTNGKADIAGGAIYAVDANLTLDYLNISNSVSDRGGAIYSANGVFEISNSTFTNNTAGMMGGAIWRLGAETDSSTLTNVTFTGNKVLGGSYGGGAVYISADSQETMTIVDAKFENNSANRGGAVYARQGTLDISDSEFKLNKAVFGGGAVYTTGTDFIANNVNMIENTSNRGGAIFSDNGTLVVTDSTFTQNTADLIGGAIVRTGEVAGVSTLTNSTFTGNEAVSGLYGGGAIYVNTAMQTVLTIKGSEFTGNKGNKGGAIHSVSGTLNILGNAVVVDEEEVIIESTFEGNKSVIGGGAVYTTNTDLTIENAAMNHNTGDRGGAIYSANGDFVITDSTFTGNTAGLMGGAVWRRGAATESSTLTNVTFTSNKVISKSYGGGAVYVATDSQEIMTIAGATFDGNISSRGAGVLARAGTVALSDYVFTVNSGSSTIYWNPEATISLTEGDRTVTSDAALINYLKEPSDTWLDQLEGI